MLRGGNILEVTNDVMQASSKHGKTTGVFSINSRGTTTFWNHIKLEQISSIGTLSISGTFSDSAYLTQQSSAGVRQDVEH